MTFTKRTDYVERAQARLLNQFRATAEAIIRPRAADVLTLSESTPSVVVTELLGTDLDPTAILAYTSFDDDDIYLGQPDYLRNLGAVSGAFRFISSPTGHIPTTGGIGKRAEGSVVDQVRVQWPDGPWSYSQAHPGDIDGDHENNFWHGTYSISMHFQPADDATMWIGGISSTGPDAGSQGHNSSLILLYSPSNGLVRFRQFFQDTSASFSYYIAWQGPADLQLTGVPHTLVVTSRKEMDDGYLGWRVYVDDVECAPVSPGPGDWDGPGPANLKSNVGASGFVGNFFYLRDSSNTIYSKGAIDEPIYWSKILSAGERTRIHSLRQNGIRIKDHLGLT